MIHAAMIMHHEAQIPMYSIQIRGSRSPSWSNAPESQEWVSVALWATFPPLPLC